MVPFFKNHKRQHLAFFKWERLGSGKALSELHTRLKRMYGHAGCEEYWKYFAVALKTFDVFQKQMYDSVITGERKRFSRLESSSNIYIVFGDACLSVFGDKVCVFS